MLPDGAGDPGLEPDGRIRHGDNFVVWWLLVIVGFIGVLIVLRPGLRALPFGHLSALISAVANAVGIIAYRMSGRNTPR